LLKKPSLSLAAGKKRRRKYLMKKQIVLIGAMVLLALASAMAADVTGKWIATVPGGQGQGESSVTLIFKVDGNSVTGTLNNTQMPGEVAINEGKLDGDNISFSLMRKIGENEMKIVWKGKVSGNEIKFTREAQGGAGGGAPTPEIIAKKAN
jgi:opacity protein-like surface antigen